MERSFLLDFPEESVQGPAVPNTTVCPVPRLIPYHPPLDDGATGFVARLSRVTKESAGPAGGSDIQMPDTFRLQGIAGWPEQSRLLMESLVFRPSYYRNGDKYLYAEGSGIAVDDYLLTSWQIDIVEKGDVVEYIDILNWTDASGNAYVTEWIWTHRP